MHLNQDESVFLNKWLHFGPSFLTKNVLKLGIRSTRGINSTTGIGSKIELDQIENELELELQYWNVKRSLKSIPEPDPGLEL